mgnify:CR=1 FL=1
MYEIILAKAAGKYFEEAHASLQKRIDRCFAQLESEPRRHNNIKPLKGQFAGYFRFRVGQYRIIYRIDDEAGTVVVVDIADRKDVYE